MITSRMIDDRKSHSSVWNEDENIADENIVFAAIVTCILDEWIRRIRTPELETIDTSKYAMM